MINPHHHNPKRLVFPSKLHLNFQILPPFFKFFGQRARARISRRNGLWPSAGANMAGRCGREVGERRVCSAGSKCSQLHVQFVAQRFVAPSFAHYTSNPSAQNFPCQANARTHQPTLAPLPKLRLSLVTLLDQHLLLLCLSMSLPVPARPPPPSLPLCKLLQRQWQLQVMLHQPRTSFPYIVFPQLFSSTVSSLHSCQAGCCRPHRLTRQPSKA